MVQEPLKNTPAFSHPNLMGYPDTDDDGDIEIVAGPVTPSQAPFTSPAPARNHNRAYVVFRGRVPGIYYTVQEMRAQVDGYSGNRHQAYTQDKAVEEWNKFQRTGIAPGEAPYAAGLGGREVDAGSPDTFSTSPAPRRDNEVYYAVVHGRHPGVYVGRVAAENAIGENYVGKARRAGTREAANALFVAAFMDREVVRFE